MSIWIHQNERSSLHVVKGKKQHVSNREFIQSQIEYVLQIGTVRHLGGFFLNLNSGHIWLVNYLSVLILFFKILLAPSTLPFLPPRFSFLLLIFCSSSFLKGMLGSKTILQKKVILFGEKEKKRHLPPSSYIARPTSCCCVTQICHFFQVPIFLVQF